jgi:hypothetical protein
MAGLSFVRQRTPYGVEELPKACLIQRLVGVCLDAHFISQHPHVVIAGTLVT